MECPYSVKAKTLCRSLLPSPWCNLPLEDIKVEPVTTGRSNRLFICSRTSTSNEQSDYQISRQTPLPQNTSPSDDGQSNNRQLDQHSKVIVRFYGSEFTGEGNQYKCISDEEEIEILDILSTRGMSPSVLRPFPGGRIDEYIESKVLDPRSLGQVDTLAILGPKICQYHATPFKCARVYDTIQILRDNYTKAVEILSNYDESKLTDHSESSLELFRKIRSFYLERPIHKLLGRMTTIKQKKVLVHFDLNYTNFLFPIDSIKSTFDVMIIDVENSQNNYRGIDLGKFFSELCIGNGSDGLNYIPDSAIHTFVDCYLNEWKSIAGGDRVDPETDNSEHLNLELKLGFLFNTVFHMTWNVVHPDFGSDRLLNNTAPRIDIFDHYIERWSQIID